MRSITLMVRNIFLSSTILFISVSSANAALFDEFDGFDGFDGETLNYQYYYPNLSSDPGPVNKFNVETGIEVSNIVFGLGTMDVINTGFIVNFTGSWWFDNSAEYNGFTLTDVSEAIPDFSAFHWVLTTDTGLTLDDVTFGTSTMGINWRGLSVSPGTYVQLEVTTVPIPAALWLFGTALIGLVGFGKRRKAA